jgi:biopolymer transport protein ExbD
MSNDKIPEDDQRSDSGFDLSAPSRGIDKTNPADGGDGDTTKSGKFDAPVDPRMSAESRSLADWRGFEEEEEYEPEVGFGSKGVFEEELDMTPMVDVTFLLLIFFMVTASFTMQKSIQQPPLSTEEPSTNTTLIIEDESQYVEVIIDQFNTYRLTSKDLEETEAPSDQEMRTRMRDMINSTMAKRVIITAHGEAFHEKVVTAWDAATDNDIADVIIRMSEEDF